MLDETSTRRVGVVAILTVLGLFTTSAAAADQVPAYLDILSANIVELPPIDAASVPARAVRLSLELAGAPSCTPATGYLAYGFLIDADKNAATGLSPAAFQPLGVDAQAVALCDPGTSAFRSLLGDVTLATDPMTGATTLAIETVVAKLPSLDLHWIAYAQEVSRFIRLPAAPGHSAWATHEIDIW